MALIGGKRGGGSYVGFTFFSDHVFASVYNIVITYLLTRFFAKKAFHGAGYLVRIPAKLLFLLAEV